MKKFIDLAIVLFAATSVTTSVFAGRGSDEPPAPAQVPVQNEVPINPAPVKTTDDQNDDDTTPPQNQNAKLYTNAQIGGIAGGSAVGGAIVAVGGIAAIGIYKNKQSKRKTISQNIEYSYPAQNNQSSFGASSIHYLPVPLGHSDKSYSNFTPLSDSRENTQPNISHNPSSSSSGTQQYSYFNADTPQSLANGTSVSRENSMHNTPRDQKENRTHEEPRVHTNR